MRGSGTSYKWQDIAGSVLCPPDSFNAHNVFVGFADIVMQGRVVLFVPHNEQSNVL